MTDKSFTRILGWCIAVAAILFLIDNGGDNCSNVGVWCFSLVCIIVANFLLWLSGDSEKK